MPSNPEPNFVAALTRDGCALVPGVLRDPLLGVLRDRLTDAAAGSAGASRRGGSGYGLRNVLALPAVRAAAQSPAVQSLVERVLGPGAFAVRALFFDKTPQANWNVPWHQDLSIAVRERPPGFALPGWGPWSEKAGVVHVQPPPGVLENMVTVRLHLDDCPRENGALRVLPGAHRLGRLTAEQIARLRERVTEAVCAAATGDVLLMRPLLPHASPAAQLPGRRRVLHLEWAGEGLPHGLTWHEQTPPPAARGAD